MASFQERANQRAARDLAEQRRKHMHLAAMMDEISDSDESGSDDEGIAIPAGNYGRRASGAAAPWRAESAAAPAGYSTGAGGVAGAADHGAGADDVDHAAAREFGAFRRASALAEAKHVDSKSDGKDDENYDVVRSIVTRHIRRGEAVQQCYVVRNKSGKHMLHPLYSLYSEKDDRLLLTAKKRMANKTSNFLIAMNKKPTDRKNDTIVGKLRAGNFSGSSYIIYDEGLNPDKAVTATSARKELGLVAFDYDKMGPGKMSVKVPRVSATGMAAVYKPGKDAPEEQTLAGAAATGAADIMELHNKRPKWDEKIGGHVLNFHGRVTMSSVKNFQLGCDELDDETVLQFGRVAQHKFTMDYQFPLNAVQAFAVCLASLDGKVADTKGYEAMKGVSSKMSDLKNKVMKK